MQSKIVSKFLLSCAARQINFSLIKIKGRLQAALFCLKTIFYTRLSSVLPICYSHVSIRYKD